MFFRTKLEQRTFAIGSDMSSELKFGQSVSAIAYARSSLSNVAQFPLGRTKIKCENNARQGQADLKQRQ